QRVVESWDGGREGCGDREQALGNGWRRKVGNKVGPFGSSKLIRVGWARRVKRARRAKLSPGEP
ncbi:hypothetical protein ACLOJK_019016, partial [Asimina triloba]